MQLQWTVGGGAERYVGAVVDRLRECGYRAAEPTVEGADVFTPPDYIIQVDAGGATVELLWDATAWTLIAHPPRGSVTSTDTLSRLLSGRADELPERVVELARPVIDEVARRWGR